MVVVATEIECVFGELGETPYEPMKEEQYETMFRELTTNQQLDVLNETLINFFGKGTMARLDPVQLFLPTLTITASTCPKLVSSQNVPSAEVGIRLTIVV